MTTYDIGPIDDLITVSDKSKIKDAYQQKRGFPAKYRFFSKNVVCFYHDSSVIPLSKSDVVTTVQTIEKYLDLINTTFNLQMPAITQGNRYALYISHTGLHPEPGNCGDGVVGAANEYVMILHPDVIKNINIDVTIIIHELGHGFFNVPWKRIWIEESMMEYLCWYFVPSYCTFYNTALGTIFKKCWINPLSLTNSTDLRYDLAAFWAFIAWKYNYKIIGDIAKNAFSQLDDKTHLFEQLASYLKTKPIDLLLSWIQACINLDFLSNVKDHCNKYFGGQGFKKPHLYWNFKTFDYQDGVFTPDLSKRTEMYGFEVSNPITLTKSVVSPARNWIVKYMVLNANNKNELFDKVPKSPCRIVLIKL